MRIEDLFYPYWYGSANWSDKKWVLEKVQSDGTWLKYASSALKKDRDVGVAAVQQNVFAFDYLDESLKKEPEIWLALIKQASELMRKADESLKKNPEFVLEVLRHDPRIFQYIDRRLLNNKEFIHQLRQLVTFSHILFHVDNKFLMKHKFFIKTLLPHYGFTSFIDDSLKKDPDFMLELIKIDPIPFQHADKGLHDDTLFIQKAIEIQPRFLMLYETFPQIVAYKEKKALGGSWSGIYQSLWMKSLDKLSEDFFDENEAVKALGNMPEDVVVDLVALSLMKEKEVEKVLAKVQSALKNPLQHWADWAYQYTLSQDNKKEIIQKAQQLNMSRSKKYQIKISYNLDKKTTVPERIEDNFRDFCLPKNQFPFLVKEQPKLCFIETNVINTQPSRLIK
jgi:hypothetical protein